MFLRPSLGVCLQPKLCSSVKNTRSLRTCIKIGKENFQLSVDVHRFDKDEIRVNVHPRYLTIKCKHKRDNYQGYASRQFMRKFTLPEGCGPSNIKCTLYPEGMLTVEGQRSFKNLTTPVEAVVIPISCGRSQREKINELRPLPPTTPDPKVFVDPCDNYPKVIPKE